MTYSDGSNSTERLISEIPLERLAALLRVSEEMSERLFHPDGEAETLRIVVRRVHDLLNAECCGIFLAPWGRHDVIELKDVCIDDGRAHAAPNREPIPVVSEPRRGLTGSLAAEGHIRRMTREEIYGSQYHSGRSAEFLPSGTCYSMLAIPLKDRKGRTLGLIKVENKKGPDGLPNDGVLFDTVDEKVAELLAFKVVKLVEGIRSANLFREFMQEMQTARNLDRIIRTVLRKAKEMVYADRVDLALWSKAKGELIVAATEGEPPTTLEKWARIPDPSIMRSVWNQSDTKGRLVRDVRQADDYFEAHPQTRSQVTICLQVGDRPIGVLSAESAHEQGFDEQDLDALRQLAPQASLVIQTVGEKSHIRGLLRHEVGHFDPSESLLNNLIQSVLDQYDMQAGMIYIADHDQKKLRCLAYVDDRIPDDQKPDHREFIFDFDETSAATHIFRTKQGVFSLDPRSDQKVDFNLAGLDLFHIDGAWVGVPLIHGERVVGVLGVWGFKNAKPISDLDDLLTPFSRLAAAHIARSVEIEASLNIHAIQEWEKTKEKLPPAARELCDGMYLRLIAIGVQAARLERARVFFFDRQKSCFRCVATLGPDQSPVGTDFRGRYSHDLVETFLSDPQARRYDPTDPTMFGPDPHASDFNKPSDLPWAVAPLVGGGELQGRIEADNAISRHEITPDSLEYLTLTASLVSQEMEKQNQSRRQEFLQASEELYHSLVDGVDAYLFRKDLEGRFTLVNDRFCKLMEHSRDQIIDKIDADFFPPETVKIFRERDRLAIEEGVSDVVDETFIAPKSGTKYTLHVKKYRVSDSNGRAIGVQGVCWDVTERQRQERKLEQQVQERTAELRASFRELHHRIKNNLGTICSFVNLQLRRIEDPKAKAVLRDLANRISTMALVHNQLHYSGAHTRLAISDYLRSLADLLQKSYAQRSHAIDVRVEAEPVELGIDVVNTCGQIVTELVCNAFKHAFPNRSSGSVSIVFRRQDADACLSVTDDGVGMPAQEFSQAGSLGLQLVRDWVRKQLHGTVNYESDKGLAIHIRFPL